jgi:hypothetical protein
VTGSTLMLGPRVARDGAAVRFRVTHYERVQWFATRNDCCGMPLATAPLAMTRRGRNVTCGTYQGHGNISLGNASRAVNRPCRNCLSNCC